MQFDVENWRRMRNVNFHGYDTKHIFSIRRRTACYTKPLFSAGIDIEVVDSCATNNGGCEHKCKHKNGAAVCSCRAGYLLQADNKTCHDVDECSTEESCCAQECTNNPGGYTCGCKHGFRLHKNGCGCDGRCAIIYTRGFNN